MAQSNSAPCFLVDSTFRSRRLLKEVDEGASNEKTKGRRRKRMAVCWAIVNQKGGVGKTTTAVNVAAYLAEAEKRVLLIDIDPQGNATSGIGVDKRSVPLDSGSVLSGEATIEEAIRPTILPTLDLVPATIHLAGSEMALVDREQREYVLRTAIESIRSRYDFILIDSPPSLGLITVNTLVAAEKVLIPLQCEYFALEGITQLLEIIDRVRQGLNPNLIIGCVVLTMYDSRNNLANQVVQEVKSYFGDVVSPTIVPRNIRLSEAPSFGKPISLYDPKSRGAAAYQAIAKELIADARGENTEQTTSTGSGPGAGGSHSRWRWPRR